MSIRFPTDDDAGMPRQSTPRRPGGGGRIFFFLIFGVIVFMLLRSMNRPKPTIPVNPNPADRNGGIGSVDIPDLPSQQKFPRLPEARSDRQRTDRGEWGLEDGPVQRNAESKKVPSISRNGDWSLDTDVATQNDTQQPGGRLLQSSNAPIKESENKKPVTNGDWSLDTDVDTTPKTTEPKKTTNGDWGLEVD